MRILEISFRDPYGNDGAGVESYIAKLATFLISGGDVVEIVYAEENSEKKGICHGIHVPRIFWKMGLAKFYYNIELYFYIRANRKSYDIVHINGDNGIFVPYIRRLKTVMTLHGSMSESANLRKEKLKFRTLFSHIFDRLDGVLEAMSCRKSKVVIAVSEHVAEYFRGVTKRRDISVVNTCILQPKTINMDVDQINALKFSNDLLCLWVGRDPIRKGLFIAKEAVKDMKNVTLITVGYIDNIPQDNVVNLGYVSNDLLYALYEASDIILFPSTNEGFSITLLEAMSYGTIPVAFSIPSTIELIEDGKSGFLVKDVNELRDKLRWLIQSKDIREKIKANAISRAGCYFCCAILPKVYAQFRKLHES